MWACQNWLFFFIFRHIIKLLIKDWFEFYVDKYFNLIFLTLILIHTENLYLLENF
jgi:hypothetical protein